MPKQPAAGKRQVALEIPAKLLARYREFVAARGETFAAAVARAIERDMTYPPPPPKVAPLPDSPAYAALIEALKAEQAALPGLDDLGDLVGEEDDPAG